MYQAPTRSSALIGRCALISRPDSTVGGKLTNQLPFSTTSWIFSRDARAYIWRQSLPQLASIISCIFSFLLRCFHPASFKTSLHIISDAKTTFSHTRYFILWQHANFYADNSTVPGSFHVKSTEFWPFFQKVILFSKFQNDLEKIASPSIFFIIAYFVLLHMLNHISKIQSGHSVSLASSFVQT